MRSFILLGVIFFGLTSCSLAPTYHRPFMPIPDHYKETGQWVSVKSKPQISQLEPWWEVFHDPVLNELEECLIPANQDLKLALARYEEACALVQVAKAGLFPVSRGLFNANRQKTSANVADPSPIRLFNDFLTAVDISYEVDVWGRIRNAVAQNQNLAKASKADFAAVRLSLQTKLASDYFALRGADESQRILDATVVAYKKALYLTRKRYRGGASPVADVDEAETQLENAKTLAADMRLKRAQLEHAIAVLLGRFPADFTLPQAILPKHIINVSPELPSTLLLRRPDIAAAELRVRAANANIGIARAAFFPKFNLTSVIGFQSKTLSNLFTKPSLFWSLGPINALTLTQPLVGITLFDGGKLFGLLKQANAQYFETVASYRQSVLTAFQEVEDNLVALRQLDQENRSEMAATRAAKRALNQARHRYTGGIITFLDVVILENTALQTELSLVNVRTRRQIASVQLIKALGGGCVTNHPIKPESNRSY